MRATTKASPPLFPGPANTTTGTVDGQRFMMAPATVPAARSIKANDVIFSSSMVKASSSRI